MSSAETVSQRRYRGRSAEQRRAERRERILDAGLELFAGHGYPATSIEAICAAAGVSTRNFYEEFSGREELLVTLHDLVNRRAMEAVTHALDAADPGDAVARATTSARAFVNAMTPDPRWSRIAYVEVVGISPSVEKHRRGWMERWAQLVATEAGRLVERGVAPRRDFSLTAVGLVGAINALLADWLARERRSGLDAVVDEIVRIVVAGLTSP
jgi:AcrR family transcriptional regulator